MPDRFRRENIGEKYVAIHRDSECHGEYKTIETVYTHNFPETDNLEIMFYHAKDSVYHAEFDIIDRGKLVDIRKLLATSQNLYYSYNESFPGYPYANFWYEFGHMVYRRVDTSPPTEKSYRLDYGHFYVPEKYVKNILTGNYSESPVVTIDNYGNINIGGTCSYGGNYVLSAISKKHGRDCASISYNAKSDGFFVGRGYSSPLFLSSTYLMELLLDCSIDKK